MKQGTTTTKKIKLDIDNSLIESIFFTIKSGKNLFVKRYPGDVIYKNGLYFLKLTQKETESLQYFCLLEAQVNFLDGSVAKSNIERFTVSCSLYTNIQGSRAGGNDKEIQLVSSDLIIVENISGPIYASDVIGLDELIPKTMTAQELRRIIEG